MFDPDDMYNVDTLGPTPDQLPSSVLAVVVPSYSDTTSTPLCVLKPDPGNAKRTKESNGAARTTLQLMLFAYVADDVNAMLLYVPLDNDTVLGPGQLPDTYTVDDDGVEATPADMPVLVTLASDTNRMYIDVPDDV